MFLLCRIKAYPWCGPSQPPIIPEGELIPDSEEMIKYIRSMGVINSLAFSSDGKLLSTASGNVIRLWNLSSGKEIALMRGGRLLSVTSLAFSPNNEIIVSGASDQSVRLWDVSTYKEIIKIEEKKQVNAVAFSPDGRMIACGTGNSFQSDGNNVQLYEVPSGKKIRSMVGHSSGVQSVAFSSDAKMLISASASYRSLTDTLADNSIRLWNLETGKEISKINSGPVMLPAA